MENTHAYEVVGEVLFRRSGNGVRTVLRCKIVRTRATATIDATSAEVLISAIATGYERLRFDWWFSDWSDEDNMRSPDYQSGRPVDIAIPVEVYDYLVLTGDPGPPDEHFSYDVSGAMIRHIEPFQLPVVTALVDGRWIEPLKQR